jgi:hypothetical protein
VLRLLEEELVFAVLAKLGFRRLGMMRTMAGGAGSKGGFMRPRVRPASGWISRFRVGGGAMAGWDDGVFAFVVLQLAVADAVPSTPWAPQLQPAPATIRCGPQRSFSTQSANTGVEWGSRGVGGFLQQVRHPGSGA